MKVHSLINFRTVTTLFVIGFALSMGVFHAQADQWDKKTILTVDQPIQVTETLLEPGQYVLKLANADSDRHIVQIFNSDQTRIIDTVLAIPNYRLEPTGNSRFTFWETPPGTAKALRAWFYPGDNFGQEFPYPKHLRQLETASAATSATVPAPMRSEASEQAAPPRPQETPVPQTQPSQPQTTTEEPQHPVEMAQNNPPQTPAATPPPPPPQPEPQPERLPKTATPYPMIGLAGLVSLALYGLLRLKTSV